MEEYMTPRLAIGSSMAIQVKGGEIAIENTKDFVKVVVWRDNVLEGNRVIMRAIVSETFMRRTGPKQLRGRKFSKTGYGSK